MTAGSWRDSQRVAALQPTPTVAAVIQAWVHHSTPTTEMGEVKTVDLGGRRRLGFLVKVFGLLDLLFPSLKIVKTNGSIVSFKIHSGSN